jgi:hypothetical protein
MNRALDTLFYQWVVTEDDKRIPTVFEDITEMDDTDKIDGVLTAYAEAVAQVIEAEVLHRSLVDEAVSTAFNDPALAEEDYEDVAQAISELDNVKESEEYADSCRNALTLLHTSLVKTLAREV